MRSCSRAQVSVRVCASGDGWELAVGSRSMCVDSGHEPRARTSMPDGFGPRTTAALCDDGPVSHDADVMERAVWGALLEAHPGPLTQAELARMFGDRVAVQDAVAALVRDGLANQAGELVFASRAAVRADQLRL